MKKIHILIFSVVMLLTSQCVSLAQNLAAPGTQPVVVPNTLYVKFKPARSVDLSGATESRTGIAEIDALLETIGATELVKFDPDPTPGRIDIKYGFDRTYSVNYSGEYTPYQVADMFASLTSVRQVSPRYVLQKTYTPNDEHLSSQWYIDKMNVKQAWNSSKGDSNVVIAILDDGINYNHDDLAPNIATNPGEMGTDNKGDDKRSNGKDDDADGYKDNWRGWDFINSGKWDTPGSWKPDNDPYPPLSNNSHGTNVAGCASPRTDNSIGVAGVGFFCRIMPLKTGDSAGTLAAGYEGIQYASKQGAKVINCSWGGILDEQYIPFVQDVIDAATERGSLVVASSGNQGIDNDITPFFPASLESVLSVGATKEDDKAQGFSNYGKSVDVFAPGGNIITTGYPGNSNYNLTFGGTSASSPIAAGVAGLMASKYPLWAPRFIIRQLVETCDNVVNTANRTKFWGRINVYNALTSPTYPGLTLNQETFKIDGVLFGALEYINKVYTLEADFTNVVGAGTGISATLLADPGYYTVTAPATATLGSMGVGEMKTGTFKFKRDPLTEGESFLTLFFYVTDGKKHTDTLWLDLEIIADDIWEEKSVKEPAEFGMKVGNLFPNPANGKVSLPLQVSEQGEYTLSVKDMLGREAYRTNEKVYTAGTHYIDIDTKSFANGMYIVTLLANGSVVRAGEFTIVK
ncbi:MAG TPA: S8 family serine peptidase [Candidatus Kapabacteria bacterium]